jgi:hypothetical protein
VFAQSDRGTITGTIADPAGVAVANAAIEASNAGAGAVYPVASSVTGNYTSLSYSKHNAALQLSRLADLVLATH